MNRQALPLVGQPVDRVDGRLKVTGQARYAAEFSYPGLVHGVSLGSTVAAGRVRDIDTTAAEKAPGVLLVLTHKNVPKMPPPPPETPQNRFTRATPLLQDTVIHHHGQLIGFVVAETIEQARHAATLVKVSYDAAEPRIGFDANVRNAYAPAAINAGYKTDTRRGDIDQGLKAAAGTVDAVYNTPIEHHHPMEMHSTVAMWEGDSKVTVHHSLQMVGEAAPAIASTFEIPRENVRVVCPFVGGGFGSKILTRDNAMLTVLAARMVKRPVKHMLTRQQMFMVVGLRQHNRQHMRLGADAGGRLTGLGHDTVTHTSVHEEFVEQTGVISRMMYNVPNSQVTHRAFRLNVQTPKWTRAPGEAPGSFALESAMDELAVQLKIDPVELRVRNDVMTDLDTGKPFGSRSLIECMRIGAEKFGWSNRSATPRSRRQGHWLVGYGMSAASRGAPHRGASANLLLTRTGRNVRAVVEMCATDLGTGSYTVIAQTAAEALGLPLDRVEVQLGDSALPPTPGSGGSWGANTFCTAALAVCEAAKQQLREKVSLRFVREPSVAELLQAAQLNEWRASNTAVPGADIATWSHYAFGANFAEVWVDEDLGLVRVPRYLAAIAAGRILNPKTAASQIIGGVVWGIGNALMEESVLDERRGHFVTRTLADYHVPVNADIGDVQVLFAPETDTRVNRMGVKGVGEIGITSVAAAIANAVYNATGRRVRDLPITPDKLLTPIQA
ncbi:xanthine dehydrogenase family protein molybdopterin-binding subunit [Variovorax sp. CCNWLW225]|uniref:xanthine dehydrogenase family protein molybdopterin-binding subunit n=1 Tax=Variovorax sp. CCNWLW225 TaxID=3127462 RepID=UPI003076DAF7